MPLKINGATNGSVTLAAPATGSDVTLTLPSSSGTVALFKALQIVNVELSSPQTTSSTTFSDLTGVSATIIPQSLSSKIMISFNANVALSAVASTVLFNLVRNGVNIAQPAAGPSQPSSFNYFANGSVQSIPLSWSYVDSPSSTSALTYKIQWKTDNASITAYFLRHSGNTNYNTIGSFTLIEIGS